MKWFDFWGIKPPTPDRIKNTILLLAPFHRWWCKVMSRFLWKLIQGQLPLFSKLLLKSTKIHWLVKQNMTYNIYLYSNFNKAPKEIQRTLGRVLYLKRQWSQWFSFLNSLSYLANNFQGLLSAQAYRPITYMFFQLLSSLTVQRRFTPLWTEEWLFVIVVV